MVCLIMQSMGKSDRIILIRASEYNAWLEYLWDTVLEFCFMMLEEYDYTAKDIGDKLPFIESCLQVF